jgi:hypothetical protein
MAQLSKYAYPMPTRQPGENWRTHSDREMDALADFQAKSNALAENEVVGGLIRFQVADGYAYYLVTKESPLTLEWVPFGDNWQVSAPTIRGLRKADVLGMLAWERKMSSLFGKKK